MIHLLSFFDKELITVLPVDCYSAFVYGFGNKSFAIELIHGFDFCVKVFHIRTGDQGDVSFGVASYLQGLFIHPYSEIPGVLISVVLLPAGRGQLFIKVPAVAFGW